MIYHHIWPKKEYQQQHLWHDAAITAMSSHSTANFTFILPQGAHWKICNALIIGIFNAQLFRLICFLKNQIMTANVRIFSVIIPQFDSHDCTTHRSLWYHHIQSHFNELEAKWQKATKSTSDKTSCLKRRNIFVRSTSNPIVIVYALKQKNMLIRYTNVFSLNFLSKFASWGSHSH